MDGTLVVEQGSIADVLSVVLAQRRDGKPPLWARPQWLLALPLPPAAAVQSADSARAATSPITTISTASSMRCSSMPTGNTAAPISRPPDQSLDDAQLAKKRHLAAKLLLERGQRVLDIGCGWGGLALYLAELCDAQRHRHHAVGRSSTRLRAGARPSESGLPDTSSSACRTIATCRSTSTASSRSACSSMSASASTTRFFRKCAALLDDDGVMLLHSIGRSEGPNVTNPWIAKYIFPGGYIPALSEVLPAIERAGLLVTDIEILRLHYAETLQGLARSASSPTATRSSGSTTRASCGCGSSIWRRRRWRSASRP